MNRRERRVAAARARQQTPTLPPPPPDEERLALRAWQLHVGMPRPPKDADLDVVEAFVEDTTPRRPEATCAALLLALDVARGRDSFLEGSWISTAVIHVPTWYDGPGFRPAGVIRLVERFAAWMRRKGWLDRDELARLLAKADEARAAIGLERRRPVIFIEPCHRFGLERLIERFIAEGELSDFAKELAGAAIRLLRTLLTIDGGPVIFGRLRPGVQVPWLHSPPDTEEEREADRQLHAIWACFYRWLAVTGQIEPRRARAIERELLRWALLAPSREV
jgi:hypothetical protein